MKEAVIVAMRRTPVGKCRGKLASIPPEKLCGLVLKTVCEDIHLDPGMVDEVIMGNLWAHDIAHMGRVGLLEAGFPVTVPSLRVDRQCSSALDAVGLAAMYIQTGHAEIVIAGGAESDSRRPYVMFKPEQPYAVKAPTFVTLYRASPDETGNPTMPRTAENLAKQYKLTREECDEYAVNSHKKAATAWEKGYLSKSIVPVEVKLKKESYVFDRDETVRPDISPEKMAKMPTLFQEEGAIVTAGNSCPMSDAAAAVVVMEKEKALSMGIRPLAKVVDWAYVGVDPNIMGIGPVYAVRKLLKKTGMTLDEIDLIELNEAFASQTISCIRELGIDVNKLNIDGGAIALGHPLAATGGILLTKIINQLHRENKRYGIVTFCCGGGQGAAMLVEKY